MTNSYSDSHLDTDAHLWLLGWDRTASFANSEDGEEKANGQKLFSLRMKLFTLARGPGKDHPFQKR
jgi:hypothetical protein